jgi:hypothetical protein
MRKHSSRLASPLTGYVGTVLGVIAIASLASFSLQNMSAKAQRHWDADIDRIIAKQQEKKRGTDVASLEPIGISTDVADESASVSAVSTGSISKTEQAMSRKSGNGRRAARRSDRRHQHYVPTAFAALPKFAVTATTTLLRPVR